MGSRMEGLSGAQPKRVAGWGSPIHSLPRDSHSRSMKAKGVFVLKALV